MLPTGLFLVSYSHSFLHHDSESLAGDGPTHRALGPHTSIMNQENIPQACLPIGQSGGNVFSSAVTSYQVTRASIELT